MAQRDYQFRSLVELPRLRARDLLALARAVVAIARKTHGLPADVAEVVDELEALAPALATSLAATAAPTQRADVRAADRAEDNAVGALVDFLTAWTRLPTDAAPEVAVAKECLGVLLEGGGLEFLTYRPVVEHSEVQRRLDNLEARGLDRAIRKMSGGAFLTHLAAVHEAYGAATGATGPRPDVESPAVREQVDATSEAMKMYVLRVAASVRRARPETQRRADVLLQPLREWSSRGAAPADEPVDDEPTDEKPVAPPADKPAAPPANDTAPAEPRRKVG